MATDGRGEEKEDPSSAERSISVGAETIGEVVSGGATDDDARKGNDRSTTRGVSWHRDLIRGRKEDTTRGEGEKKDLGPDAPMVSTMVRVVRPHMTSHDII